MMRSSIIPYEVNIPGLPSYYWRVDVRLSNNKFINIAYGQANTLSQCKAKISKVKKQYAK